MRYEDLLPQLQEMGIDRKKAMEINVHSGVASSFNLDCAPDGNAAADAKAYLNAIYANESLCCTRIWQIVADVLGKVWYNCFTPLQEARGERLGREGIELEFDNGTVMFVPPQAPCTFTDILVFDDDTVNEFCGDRVMTVEGAFTVAGLHLEGIYDILRAPGATIFRKWLIDEYGDRIKYIKQSEEIGCIG